MSVPNATQTENGNTEAAASAHAPRRLTLSENVMLTIKVVGIAGLLGGLLWGLEALTSGS